MKYRNLSNITLDTTSRQNSFRMNKYNFDNIRDYQQSNINTTQQHYFDNSIESEFYNKNHKNHINEDVSQIINSSMLFNDYNFQRNQNNQKGENQGKYEENINGVNQKQIHQKVDQNVIWKSNIENINQLSNIQNILQKNIIDKQTTYKWFDDYRKKQRKKKLLKNYLLPKMNHHQKNNTINQSSELNKFKKTLKPIKNNLKKQTIIQNIEIQHKQDKQNKQNQQNKQNLIKNIKIQISLQQCHKKFKQRCKIQLLSLQIKPFNEIKKQKCFFNLHKAQFKQLIENKTQVQSFRHQTDRCKFIPLKLQSAENTVKIGETSIPEFLMTQINYKNKSVAKRKFLEFRQHRSEIFMMQPIELFKTVNYNKNKYMNIG